MNASEGIFRNVVINVRNFICCGRQCDLSTEFGPLSNGCRIELMLLLDSVSRNAVNDVREQNLHEVKVILLKPSTVSEIEARHAEADTALRHCHW
jgi:hypothetical protein